MASLDALPPLVSRLEVGEGEALPLDALAVRATIDGFRARVELDLRFRNDRDQQLRGKFRLRLPDGAAPHALAFGLAPRRAARVATPAARGAATARIAPGPRPSGPDPTPARPEAEPEPALKHAVMVPRARAAEAYVRTIRRRVDPALLEWTGAGVFRADVFPIEPKRAHRVVLAYDIDLRRDGDGRAFELRLPEVPRLRVDLDVGWAEGQRVEVSPATPVAREGHRLRYAIVDQREVVVRLSAPATTLCGADESGAYTAAQLVAELPPAPVREAAGRVVFALDRSLSTDADAFRRQLAFIQAVLRANRPRLRRFAVLGFSIDQRWWRPGFTDNTAEAAADFDRYARDLVLEGATDLQGALAEAARPAWLNDGTPHDLLLLGDATPTWGDDDPDTLSRAVAAGVVRGLFAFPTASSALMTRLTGQHGGAVFPLTAGAAAQGFRALATAHTAVPWRLESVRIDGLHDVLIDGDPRTLVDGQRLTLAGRGRPAAGATVLVSLSRASERRAVALPLGARVDSELAPRVFGALAVGSLEAIGSVQQLATQFATHFRVVGRSCSLLMLEGPRDYQRFGIHPRATALRAWEAVVTTPAAPWTEHARRMREVLGPRARFLDWLARSARQASRWRGLPEELTTALAALEQARFAVAARPLRCAMPVDRAPCPELARALAPDASRAEREALDAAIDRRRDAHGPDDALLLASSLVEARPGELGPMRDAALCALALGRGDQAFHTAWRVARAREWQLPFVLVMARCLADAGRAEMAIACYEVVLLEGSQVALAALPEYASLLRRVVAGQLPCALGDYPRRRLDGLHQHGVAGTRADLLVSAIWSTGATDVDLIVREPDGGFCCARRESRIGGQLLLDGVRSGYGPELYWSGTTRDRAVTGSWWRCAAATTCARPSPRVCWSG